MRGQTDREVLLLSSAMAEFFQVELDTLAQYAATLQQAQQQLADLPKLQ